MNSELLTTNASLLMAWLFGLAFTVVFSFVAGLFPVRLEPVRKSLFAILIFPPLVVAVIYALRGFGTLERPLVHWVFEKEAVDSLRLGLIFDPLSLAVSFFSGIATIAIAVRNRPSVRMSAALALSWVGLGLAATAQTLWMAALGIGIQFLSRALPLIEGGVFTESEDARWIASTKRAWIGLASILCGSAGLAAQGIHLDFFSENTWAALESSPNAIVAGGLLVLGLLVMAAPAFASNSLFSKNEKIGEENLFVSETSLAWISVLVLYRLFAGIHEPMWLLVVGIGATIATVGSLAALTFQPTRASASHLWLSTYPVALLTVLPFLPAREAHLFLVGGFIAFHGLWLSLDHRRSKLEIAAAATFLLGAFGFVGWATSAGFTSFFSKLESDPFLRAPIFVTLLVFAAFGWRLVIRGGDRESTDKPHSKWIALGIFFVLGFGPILSGRWGGGAIPDEGDWIEGAKAWAWIMTGGAESATDADFNWVGFGITHGLGLFAALIGIFAWRTADLFPFGKKYPRGALAAEGLFGLVWIQKKGFDAIHSSGRFLVEKVSTGVWERGLPRVVGAVFEIFRRGGVWAEALTDTITSAGYGRVFTPASKLVQWLHGGNVRLYAWIALVWILIFSIYLTR